MARNTFLTDFLQQYPFWLLDVSPIDQIGLPLFTPVFGFSSISAPEMSVEVAEFTEGNSLYKRRVIKRANVSPITMTRGVGFLDSDFYRWTMAALKGDPEAAPAIALGLGQIPGPSVRRNLLLMHMFRRQPTANDTANDALAVAGIGGATVLASSIISAENGTGALGGVASVATNAIATAGFAAASIGPADLAVRMPAKAWLLFGCIPTRYKAASDFDASSSAVSVQEIDFEYERFEEIGLLA